MAESFDPQQTAEFDRYASSYEEMHAASIAASGESTEYFAIYKQRVMEQLLGKGFDRPVLDFGCGIGRLTALLAQSFPVVHGFDPSSKSAELAQKRTPSASFFHSEDSLLEGHYGAVVLGNVLHHVLPAKRPALLKRIGELLAEGGKLVVFEHNPLNPITRHAVAICPFDHDAVLLYPWTVKARLREVGLSNVELEYIVFFPRQLRFARPLEPHLGWLPLGAQVCAWGTKT